MNELVVTTKASDWRRLKALVLDSVSSPITKRVYNLGLDEFFAWYSSEPRAGLTKATVSAWRVALEARGLGSVSINVRITAVRKLAVEAADNGLLAPELAAGIARVKGAKSIGVRVGNWLSLRQAQNAAEYAGRDYQEGPARPGDARSATRLRSAPIRGGRAYVEAYSAARQSLVHSGPRRQARASAHDPDADMGEERHRRLDDSSVSYRWPCAATCQQRRSDSR